MPVSMRHRSGLLARGFAPSMMVGCGRLAPSSARRGEDARRADEGVREAPVVMDLPSVMGLRPPFHPALRVTFSPMGGRGNVPHRLSLHGEVH